MNLFIPPSARQTRAVCFLLGSLVIYAVHAGQRLEGKVVGVSDGDTVTILEAARKQHKIRLSQIDAPEKQQDYGVRSKQSLSQLVYGKRVTIDVATIDQYGRKVGKVRIDDLDVNLEQVKRGMAWVYRSYAREPQYFEAEAAARKGRKGLWAQAKPTPPWEFRHQAKEEESSFLSEWLKALKRWR